MALKYEVSKIFYGLIVNSLAVTASCIGVETKDFIIMNAEKMSGREHDALLQEQFPIVRCGFQPSKYERVLLTKLRDKNTLMHEFRNIARKLAEQLIDKVVECLPTTSIKVDTPLVSCTGEILAQPLELVSIMRSGDALLETFIHHFPEANISKILVQRDEETAKPIFKYMKISQTISEGHPVVITEPMIATGGSLSMSIELLKEHGVKEENIIVASICTAPEGLQLLSKRFPNINIVMTVLDEKLNEKKFIEPGIGDFGDRYFGTVQ